MAASLITSSAKLLAPEQQEVISVRGARVHNLKNISFAIPHNQITVVTGVSGSGKSSLAFDTIYAEGQRRYIESLSSYARQFLERIEKPDVDEITGIAPAIAIRQKNSTRNPRSTVATATEIYDYLRLLYARVGKTLCTRLRRRSAPRHDGRNCQARARNGRGAAIFRAVSAAVSRLPRKSPARENRRAQTLKAKQRNRPRGACRIAKARLRAALSRTAACLNFPRLKLCSK